jgi:hypothetical protein
VPLVVPNYDKITYTILIEFKKRKDNPSPFRRGFGGLGILGCWGFGVWGFGILVVWGCGVLGLRGFVVSGFCGFGVLGCCCYRVIKNINNDKKVKSLFALKFPIGQIPPLLVPLNLTSITLI